MTDRIKLTEEHFILCEDKQYGFSMLIRLNTTSYDEFKQLKQQILNDYDIVEEITDYAEQLRYSKPTIAWQLREFLGLNKID